MMLLTDTNQGCTLFWQVNANVNDPQVVAQPTFLFYFKIDSNLEHYEEFSNTGHYTL